MSSIPEHESEGTHKLPEMSTTLCQHCQAISLDDEKLGRTIFALDDGEPFLYFGRDVEGSDGRFSIRVGGDREDGFPDLPGLQLSAANGCSLCGLLRSAVLNEFPPQEVNRDVPDTAIRTLVLKNFEYHWLSIEESLDQKQSLAYLAILSVNVVVQGRDEELSRHIYFEFCAPPGRLATWLRIPWNVADEDALSPGRIRDIKSWISDCERNCHHAGITTVLPTRLIDVGSNGEDQIRLVLSSDILATHPAESYKYVTLSYCWGDPIGKPFVTTQSTLRQFLQKIPIKRLPRTCRDAVTITRSLGIRYLWIDAFCIVQDDPNDWNKELVIMGKIYTNSYLTLVALQGESCHHGFLDRKTARKAEIHYKSSLNPHVNGIYYLRQVSTVYAYLRMNTGKYAAFSYDEGNSRWKSRGWTSQEKHLSTRKLMFGAERMYYDCGVIFRTENMHGLLTLQSAPGSFLISLSKGLTPKDLYTAWYIVVSDYSKRDLTYSTDRLPAISGLAETTHERVAGNYLAGLWQSDLFNGLLWGRPPSDRSVTSRAAFIDSVAHPKHYMAPSWSWARSQNGVDFVVAEFPPFPKNVPEIETLEATTDLIGPNPFGGVRGGHLLLRGKTFGLKGAWIFGFDGTKEKHSDWMNGKIWLEVINHNGSEIARCILDWELSETAKRLQLCEAPWDELTMLITASCSIDNKDRKESEKENRPEELRQYFGLLLLPTTREADSWVRVGVCMLRSDIHGRTVLDNCSEKIVKLV